MIKACEYKTCCNFFTLGRKKEILFRAVQFKRC